MIQILFNFPETINQETVKHIQGHKTRCKNFMIWRCWNHTESSYHCGIILEINIKRYLKITHIFSSEMWHLPRETFDLAIESLNKVRRLKNHRRWSQRKKHLNEKLIGVVYLLTVMVNLPILVIFLYLKLCFSYV